MPFDGSGNYALSDTIAPATNADANELQAILTDIGTALDACVVADGQSPITGALKGADGTVALPAYAFNADLDSGFYRIGANNIGLSLGGTKRWDYGAAGSSLTGTLDVSGNFAINTNKFTVAGASGNTVIAGTTTHSGLTTMTGAAVNEAFTTIASAGTCDIGAAAANYLQVTGTTTITAFGTVQAGTMRTLEFQGAVTLTHNATSLILPGAANITTAAGDTAIFRSEGSGNWRCISFTRATGMVSTVTTQVFTANGTYTPRTGLIYAIIDCVGGGGSGAGGTSAAGRIDAGAGGHGGNHSRAIATAATIGASQTVTVGAGGTAPAAGNNNGGAGGQTSFGAICVANGGNGGNYGAVGQIPTPGTAGAAGTGSVFAHVNGNSGGGGVNQSIITVINANSNPGGASGMGTGGARPAVAASTATATGTAAIANTGGGGGGGMGNNTATTFAGGNGGSGIVIVTEFSTQ